MRAVLYLPAYSPDPNPVEEEEAFAELKALLRSARR